MKTNSTMRSDATRDARPAAPAARRPIDLTAFLICVALSMVWGLQQTAIKAAAGDVSQMLQVAALGRGGGAPVPCEPVLAP